MKPQYEVIAPLVVAHRQVTQVGESAQTYHYRGSFLPENVVPEQVAQLLEQEMIRPVPQAVAEVVEEITETPVPAKTADKSEWVAYAVSTGMDADEASKLTKVELVARFASPAPVEQDPPVPPAE